MTLKFIFFSSLLVMVDSLKLEQVFILSRHNVRAPLTTNLQRMTSLDWPVWNEPASHLTERGRMLEKKMGDYFALWLQNNQLFPSKCPHRSSVYVYANNVQRTMETATAFSNSAFKNCDIVVNSKPTVDSDVPHRDPVFCPVLRNQTESFRETYKNNMRQKLNNLHLEDAYDLLDRIVDITNADVCKQESFCSFNIMKSDDIKLIVGEEPDLDGPLAIGNYIVDSFLMRYYNGRPEQEVAWGKIKTNEEWRTLLDVTRENQNVRFNQSHLARDIARPMLNYIKDAFLKEGPRMIVLVGHDSNQNSVMAALGFKKYNLTGQYELTPVGGKIVFQKWRDDDANYFLKIEYVYASMQQIRDVTSYTLENPPFFKVMELQSCKINENGFCPWADFVKLLESL